MINIQHNTIRVIKYLVALVLFMVFLAVLGVDTVMAKTDSLCGPDTMLQKPDNAESCSTEEDTLDDTRTAKSEIRAANDEDDDTPPPIGTIREGQSFTYTAPIPRFRQVVTCSYGQNGRWVQNPITNEAINCRGKNGNGGGFVWGTCNGPWTLEILSNDSRVTADGGRQVRVSTDANDNLDDTGSIEVTYTLNGSRTVTWYGLTDVYIATTTTADCSLENTVRVDVRPASRLGMTVAVAIHAPPQEYLNTPSTVTWTCTEEIIEAGIQCTAGSVVSTTTTPTFPTPRGCVVVVTVASNGRGHGSTGCFTSDEAASFGDMIDVDINSLPDCPLSTAPADLNELPDDSGGRKRCVARN